MFKIKSVIDLTQPLGPKTNVYEGLPKLVIEPINTIRKDKFSVQRIQLSTHHATHIDAPIHFITGQPKTLSDFPPDYFVGRGVLINIPRFPYQPISAEDLEYEADEKQLDIKDGDIALICTGFATKYYQDVKVFLTRHPYLDGSGAQWCVDHQFKIIGIDCPGIEKYEHKVPETTPAHNIILGAGRLALEGLVNLEKIQENYPLVVVAPLPIYHGDGAPARVFAIEFSK